MGNDWRLRTKIPIRSSRKIAIEGTNTSCDGDKGHRATQKSSEAENRPESACLQLPNDRRAAQYSHPLFIVGQPVQSSETPTPERHRVTPRLYQGMPAARVVPERPTARQRGDSKRRQRTGHTLSALVLQRRVDVPLRESFVAQGLLRQLLDVHLRREWASGERPIPNPSL